MSTIPCLTPLSLIINVGEMKYTALTHQINMDFEYYFIFQTVLHSINDYTLNG